MKFGSSIVDDIHRLQIRVRPLSAFYFFLPFAASRLVLLVVLDETGSGSFEGDDVARCCEDIVFRPTLTPSRSGLEMRRTA